jgi:hypothetical protein
LVGGTSKTEVRGMVADKIAAPPVVQAAAAPPVVQAAAAPPVVQAAATKVASDGGRRRESVNKTHKKRSRANKRKAQNKRTHSKIPPHARRSAEQ